MPSSFRPVPDDAPELMRILREFHAKLLANQDELPNAWGAIIINDIQANLKRIDVVISWDAVQIEMGQVVRDALGNPIYEYAVDANGQTIFDENGNPVIARRFYTRHIYLHADSAYFRH
jgi:hypothetical protein